MPVLSIGGEKSLGNELAAQMKLVATDVTVVVLKDTGIGSWKSPQRKRPTPSSNFSESGSHGDESIGLAERTGLQDRKGRSTRDEKAGQAYCNQVFGYGDENVFDVPAHREAFSDFITCEGSDHGADGTQHSAEP